MLISFPFSFKLLACTSLILHESSLILLLTFMLPSSLINLLISPKIYGTAYVESFTSKDVSNLLIDFIKPIEPI